MYCEKCKRIIQEERCPFCKRSIVREPEQKDLCLLTERDYISSGILEDILQQR
jgi:RNA polymerase subunit RPABC4/transcription elongation factor Spt4